MDAAPGFIDIIWIPTRTPTIRTHYARTVHLPRVVVAAGNSLVAYVT